LTPGLLGITVALVLWLAGETRRLRFTVAIALVVAAAGLAVSLVAVVVWWWRRSRQLAVATAVRQADSDHQATARAAHRQFLARLDHELKNPVTAIRASVAAARAAQGGDQPGVAEPLAVIDSQSQRVAALVGDLRKLAELETAPLEMAPVDLEELIGDVVQAAQDELALSGGGPRAIELQLPTVPWRLPAMTGDVDLLSLAVHNLVANAVKYSAPGAAVTVRAMEDSGGVIIEVADTGQGIPPAEVSQVWDELARASNARGLPGSGLGLALVRTVVERHGGRVQLSSRLGEGTSVRLWLPLG
jgi:two-component system OmpR family sensor kinase